MRSILKFQFLFSTFSTQLPYSGCANTAPLTLLKLPLLLPHLPCYAVSCCRCRAKALSPPGFASPGHRNAHALREALQINLLNWTNSDVEDSTGFSIVTRDSLIYINMFICGDVCSFLAKVTEGNQGIHIISGRFSPDIMSPPLTCTGSVNEHRSYRGDTHDISQFLTWYNEYPLP